MAARSKSGRSTGADGAPALIGRLFRTEAGRLIAHFTRRFGPSQLDLAEEVVQDALVQALQLWPYRGVPRNPTGWLYRVACNRALDVLRRRSAFGARAAEIARALARDRDDADRPDRRERRLRAVEDDELAMVLMCCHPSLTREAQVTLSLKTVCGLSVGEIARALLCDERSVAQRLVRAKRRIRARRVSFEMPVGRALAARVESAVDVIYLLFNEGYAASSGDDIVRADLCREALRLGLRLADAPAVATPRVHALVALMALHAARAPARRDSAGDLVLLEDQDRSAWDRDLLALGFEHLQRSMNGPAVTPLHLQAAIAATHASAPTADATDWRTILELYDELVAVEPSPVARLNRAVAVAKVHGPRAGLAALSPLARERALARYYLLPAVRGDLLARAGDVENARRAYRLALSRPCSNPERRFLESRLRRIVRTSA